MTDYLSVATVATVGNGTKSHTFAAKEMPLDDLLKEVGLSRKGMTVRVRHNGWLGKPVNNPASVKVRDGDLVFLVPPVRGG